MHYWWTNDLRIHVTLDANKIKTTYPARVARNENLKKKGKQAYHWRVTGYINIRWIHTCRTPITGRGASGRGICACSRGDEISKENAKRFYACIFREVYAITADNSFPTNDARLKLG